MVSGLVKSHSLYWDDVSTVRDLLEKVNSALKDYSVGIRENKHAEHTWQEIEIFIEAKDGNEVKTNGLFTNYIHIEGDIKKVFSHLFLYGTAEKLYI